MLDKIKSIRNTTGAGVVDIKKALEEANGDEQQAINLLRKRGLEKAVKKGDRETKEGAIGFYVHTNGKLAAMVKLYCETDFVGRNEEFLELARDLAMHVSAMNPRCLKAEDMPNEYVQKQKDFWLEQLKEEGKPAEIIETIIKGKEAKLRKEESLLSQAFVKDPERTVEEVVKEKIAKIGENIQVGEFVRLEL